MIDKGSPVPIYHQIAEYIKHQIEDKTLKAGTLIPSERELTERFDVSRMTVRQAIQVLAAEGYVDRQKGRGSFVKDLPMEQPLSGLTSFTEQMQKRGRTATSEILAFEKVDPELPLSQLLQISDSQMVIKLKRLRLADGLPVALETAYIPTSLGDELTEALARGSIYNYFETVKKVKMGYAHQEVLPYAADEETAGHLDVKKGHPLLKVQRQAFGQDGEVLEYAETIYRGDRYKFVIDLQRD